MIWVNVQNYKFGAYFLNQMLETPFAILFIMQM